MSINKIWTKEKNDLLKKFKKEGKDTKFLLEYFGEELYESGKYSKNNILPYFAHQLLQEIQVHPIETKYTINRDISFLDKTKFDYILKFDYNNINYIILLMFFKINNTETYNAIFTTKKQYDDYKNNLNYFTIKNNSKISKEEHKILADIIEKETNYNVLFPIFKRLTYIIQNFYENNLKNSIFSVGETSDKVKINFYRNVIHDSFENIQEFEEIYIDENNIEHIYYCYKM